MIDNLQALDYEIFEYLYFHGYFISAISCIEFQLLISITDIITSNKQFKESTVNQDNF